MTDLTATAAPCGCACDAVPEEELNARLEEVIREYRDKPGGLIPALQTAQALFGYLPEPVIRKIADGFGKPVSEGTGVVTFYSFFTLHPRGKFLVRVCLGTACYVCGMAPVVMVNETVYQRVKPARVGELVNQIAAGAGVAGEKETA